jgi:small-conductance mechanosensitive channel
LKWIIPVVVVSGALASTMEAAKQLEFSDSLAKLTLITLGIGFTIFTARILRFSGGVVSELIANHPNEWLTRLRYIWYPLAVGITLLFVALVALGYFCSALNFELRVFINDIKDWIQVLHKLKQATDLKFRQNAITISFQQRDVHLDVTGPLEVKVVSGHSDSKSSVPQSDSQ